MSIPRESKPALEEESTYSSTTENNTGKIFKLQKKVKMVREAEREKDQTVKVLHQGRTLGYYCVQSRQSCIHSIQT